jgi:hypothetical protein
LIIEQKVTALFSIFIQAGRIFLAGKSGIGNLKKKKKLIPRETSPLNFVGDLIRIVPLITDCLEHVGRCRAASGLLQGINIMHHVTSGNP